MNAPLARFSPATREWFTGAFAEPTTAQAGAWDAISSGSHALVVAPTGSGKTLAAFLWSIDRLITAEAVDPRRRTRVLYVSPLKALGVDVERNLRSPLVGVTQTARRLGLPAPEVTVGVRSGDTSTQDRRLLARVPPDILITTPESLFLMLTSAARETLLGIDTVIVDEVHAVAATKRGAHLAVSLERLDALLPKPAQRIGLSATVRPHEEVARFLGGRAPVTIVAPPSTKRFDLTVVVPVDDMTELGTTPQDGSPGAPAQGSIWPHVEERIVDLILEHRSTIVFANSRRLAERLTGRLNEIYEERLHLELVPAGVAAFPAQLIGQSGVVGGSAGLLARAHHGSVSKDQRAIIEDDLKSGRLRCVVATSSLELGIDMGEVDLVVQVESRRRSRAACSASAAPGTRSARSRAACSFPSTGPTSSTRRSSPSGWSRARSRRSQFHRTRSTSSRSRPSPRSPSNRSTSRIGGRPCAGVRRSRPCHAAPTRQPSTW